MTLPSILFGKKTQEVSSLTASQVESMLETARPAEKAVTSHFGASAQMAEFPNLIAHESRDGVWVCCCGHENPMVHYEGSFPFKYLACTICGHGICGHCETTGIIVLVQDSEVPAIHHDDGSELRFFQVCPGCGLTYRAEFYAPSLRGKRVCWVPTASHPHPGTCICGEAANFDWLKYRIGTPHVFRSNPEKVAHDCQMKMLRKRTKVATSQYPRRSTIADNRATSTWKRPGRRHTEATASELINDRFGKALSSSSARQDRLPDKAVKINASSLHRSGAHRGRRPSNTPHSTASQGVPITSRRPLNTRSETWTTAEGHRRAHDAADDAVKSFMGRR